MKARDGDSFLISFECDRCIFLKLRGSLPSLSDPSDQLLMGIIRRIHLDSFWSCETSTVKANLAKVKWMLETSLMIGLSGPFKIQPPIPLFGHCGYEVAHIILLRPRHPGKHKAK